MKNLSFVMLLMIAGAATQAAMLLREDFTYADGALTNVSAMKWRTHSGTPGEVNVTGGGVELNGAETEDVNAALTNSVTPASGGVVFTRFTFTLAQLPSGASTVYFAHLNSSSSQRGKIFLTTTGNGLFRLGVGNSGSSPSRMWAADLYPNQSYTVLTRYVVSNAVTTLWIDPVFVASPSITGMDVANPTTISAFGLRQESNLGVVFVDDLFVATSFSEALSGNAAPTISAIAPQLVAAGGTTRPIPFTVGDAETEAEQLDVWAYTTNGTAVQNITVVPAGSNGTVTVTVAPELLATNFITICVTDGLNTNRVTFPLATLPPLLFADDFNYVGGPLISNAAPTWTRHGGGTGEIQVVNSQLALGVPFTEDVNTVLPLGPFAAEAGLSFYASFRIHFSELPGSSGDYVAHFNTSGARCRFIAQTLNAAPGKFRLAIANANVDLAAPLPLDLVTNLSHLVVLRYDADTATSTLWVNPLGELDRGTNATDIASPVPVSTFCFRQSASIGKFTVDDLRVGLTFAAVTSATSFTPRLCIEFLTPEVLQVSWPATLSGFTLQSNTELNGAGWYDVDELPELIGDRFVVTKFNFGGSELFRLRRLPVAP